jgi:3-hydroxyacyl-CoA dehydrogenase/enoyl-CoA hydratase/3-hydroxybutyryl-CoA epimerase
MKNAFELNITEENIAILTFDLPGEKANKFSTPVMQELDNLLDDLSGRKDISCLIIQSGKPTIYIAGADINEIEHIIDPDQGYQVSRVGQDIFAKIEKLPFPTIALINGACMGGGTEMTLACTYRLASDHPKTKLALPEVNIGLFPGWGGTQRLPRLIGLQRSLDVILTGRNLNAKRALRSGIIDKIVPQELVLETGLQFARSVIAGENVLARSKRKQKGLLPVLLEKNPLGRAIVFRMAKKAVLQKTHGHYPAPLAALKVIKKGYRKSLQKGLEIEAKSFAHIICSNVSKNLIKIFFWTEAVKKQSGVASDNVSARNIGKAAALGAGVMGGGIAQLFAGRNIPIRVKDLNNDALAKAYQQAAGVLKGKLRRRRISKMEFGQILSRITATTDYSGFKKSDFVIEAIVEDLEIKKKVLSELETNVQDDAIIVSNTSSLLIDDMAVALQKPERFAGMHFFNPVHMMPLVEVIRGKNTSDETIATTFNLAKTLGKTPVIVNDGPGFLVNRLLVPYMVEAVSLLEEGYTIEHIDRMIETFGMPMGPIELFDEVGIDVAHKVAKILAKSMGDRMAESPILEKLIADGRMGKKSGKGFYLYEGKNKKLDKSIETYIEVTGKSSLSEEALVQRMIYPMINEAARCLDEQIVMRPQDVDLAMIFGTGFAPFRGGLLNYADSESSQKIYESLLKFADQHGNRFAPSEKLKEMAASGKGFYQYYGN